MRRDGALTEDRVHNLAVCATRAALLDLGVVDLQQVVQPRQKLRARLSHVDDA